MILFRLLLLLTPIWASVIPSLTQEALANAQVQNFRSTKDMNSLFLKLPSLSEIQEVILGADSFAMTKLIQSIKMKSSEIPCDLLVQYSDEIIGMIKVVIHRRAFLSQQLQVIIRAAEKQIERLTSEISKINNERDRLPIKDKMSQLEQLLMILNQKYGQFNEFKQKQDLLNSQLQSFYLTEQKLQRNGNEQRNLLTQQKLDLVNYESWIKKMQEEIVKLKSKKKQTQSDIKVTQGNIIEVEKKIELTRKQINQIQEQLIEVQIRSDALKKEYSRLQIQMQRLRAEISEYYMKEMSFSSKVKDLQQKADFERTKLAYEDLKTLNYYNSVLQKNLPKFIQHNNQIRFECSKSQKSINVLQSGSTIIYIVKGTALTKYLQNSYNIKNVPFIQDRDLRLSVCDTFSPSWGQNFGPAFQSSDLANTSGQVYLQGSFSCLSEKNTYSDIGMILYVKNNFIRVRTNANSFVSLNIGACTRIQSQFPLPRVGQKIFFKGTAQDEGYVNLFQATCI